MKIVKNRNKTLKSSRFLLSQIGWYKNFSDSNIDSLDAVSQNQFIPVKECDLEKFEEILHKELPESYKKFLLSVGWGRFQQDENGNITNVYSNIFLPIDKIVLLLGKSTFDWLINPDLIEDNEIPFFEIANQSHLVFRLGSVPEDRVFFPGLPDAFAENFAEFLCKLRSDVVFYTKTGLPDRT